MSLAYIPVLSLAYTQSSNLSNKVLRDNLPFVLVKIYTVGLSTQMSEKNAFVSSWQNGLLCISNNF